MVPDIASLIRATKSDATSRSRGIIWPKFCWKPCPPQFRGRREDRVRAAPAVSCAVCIKKMLHMSIQVWRKPPAFPAQWLYGLYEFAPVTGFVATVIAEEGLLPAKLDASTGASGPHDFTVR